MKLFLVDDEPLTAKWIESVISRSGLPYRVIGTAGTGAEALEKLRDQPADLVITDIRMPGMDGLELIGRLKEIFPEVAILIVSSHSDFRYTSEAIRLGAHDYLLKSEITEEELLSSLERIGRLKSEVSEPTARADKDEPAKRLDALKLIRRSGKAGPEREEALRTLKLDRSPVFCLLLSYPAEDYSDEILPYIESLNEILGGYITVTAEQEGRLCLTGRAGALDEPYPMKKLLSGAMVLREKLFARYGKPFFFGLSSIHSTAEDFPSLYEEAREALDLHEFYRNRPGAVGSGLSLAELRENRKDLEEDLKEIDWEISLKNWLFAREKCEKILDRMETDRPVSAADAREIAVELYLRLSSGKGRVSHINRLNGCGGYRELKGETLRLLEELPRRDESLSLRTGPVDRACEIIKERYGESQISLVNVAEEVGLNSTYFSHLFRKKTGRTFQDYLSGVRLEKAEYLLKYSGLSMTEITERVGFQSNSYFARFFKKRHGISPSEYREQK